MWQKVTQVSCKFDHRIIVYFQRLDAAKRFHFLGGGMLVGVCCTTANAEQ
jgi:hypothetical protein